METLKDRVDKLCDKIYTGAPEITKGEMREEIEAALISERDLIREKLLKVFEEDVLHFPDKFEELLEIKAFMERWNDFKGAIKITYDENRKITLNGTDALMILKAVENFKPPFWT